MTSNLMTSKYALTIALCVLTPSLIFVGLSIYASKKPKKSKTISTATISTAPMPSNRYTKKAENRNVIPSNKTNIIFDLNGVLFGINKSRALTSLGFFETILYTIAGNGHDELEHLIFDIMYRMENTSLEEQLDLHKNKLVPLYKDKPMPRAMCDWMRGILPGHELIDKIHTYIETMDTEKHFKSDREKKLVARIIHMMFDPETRCDLYEPIHKGVRLLKRCKKLGHNVYLLSNMDTELIDLLKEKHADIFNLFDGIIISADVQMLKPHRSIYDHLLREYELDADTCYFIDDSPENITGARHAGITAVHCDPTRYHTVFKELKDFGVLDIQPKDEQETFVRNV